MDPSQTEAVYRRLARRLDNLPGGFPSTETGVEQRILRRLFSPEEAALAVRLTLVPEPRTSSPAEQALAWTRRPANSRRWPTRG